MSSPIIFPSSVTLKGLGQTQAFTVTNAAAGTINWTCSAGAISAAGVYTPPNRTGTYNVTATRNTNDVNGSAGEASSRAVAVEAVMFADPSEGSDGRTEKRVRVSQAINRGMRQFRSDSGARRRYNLVYAEREQSELDEAEAFFQWHAPAALAFWWTNLTLQQERRFQFAEEKMLWVAESHVSFEYRWAVREKAPVVPVYATSSTLQTFSWVADYEYEASVVEPSVYSDAPAGHRVARADGARARAYSLRFVDRDPAEFLAFELFWNKHYPGRCFNYTDPVRGVAGVFRFDSDIAFRDRRPYGIDYEVQVVQYTGAGAPVGVAA